MNGKDFQRQLDETIYWDIVVCTCPLPISHAYIRVRGSALGEDADEYEPFFSLEAGGELIRQCCLGGPPNREKVNTRHLRRQLHALRLPDFRTQLDRAVALAQELEGPDEVVCVVNGQIVQGKFIVPEAGS